MENKKYKTVQIPIKDFELLKDYCNYYGLIMGKYLGGLIKTNCPPPRKISKVTLKAESIEEMPPIK